MDSKSRKHARRMAIPAFAGLLILLTGCGVLSHVDNAGRGGGSPVGGSSPGGGGSTTACHPPSLAHCFTEATMETYLNDIVPMVEGFYTSTWAHPLLPGHIYFIPDGQSIQSGCQDSSGGDVMDDMSYAYCPADNNVYLGQAMLWQLYSQAGDVAPAIGLAHEMGHEQQTNVGVPVPQTDAESVNHEDQADCFSGAWFDYEIGQGNIQAEDYPSTGRYLDLIASAENDPNRDHGDLQQRLDSFIDGEKNGAFGCNRFYPLTPVITSS
jgi:predicted metalloprotease